MRSFLWSISIALQKLLFRAATWSTKPFLMTITIYFQDLHIMPNHHTTLTTSLHDKQTDLPSALREISLASRAAASFTSSKKLEEAKDDKYIVESYEGGWWRWFVCMNQGVFLVCKCGFQSFKLFMFLIFDSIYINFFTNLPVYKSVLNMCVLDVVPAIYTYLNIIPDNNKDEVTSNNTQEKQGKKSKKKKKQSNKKNNINEDVQKNVELNKEDGVEGLGVVLPEKVIVANKSKKWIRIKPSIKIYATNLIEVCFFVSVLYLLTLCLTSLK